MRLELVALLVCPECGGQLDLHPFRSGAAGSDEIEEGVLLCGTCACPYPITQGIPRLLPDAVKRHPQFRRRFALELEALRARSRDTRVVRRFEKLHRLTARAFGYEWNVYRTTSQAEDVLTFFWLTGLDPGLYRTLALTDVFSYAPTPADLAHIDASGLAGATVLDVGCGMGKYLAVVSEHAKMVIGLDLSDALVRARALLRERPNVHLIQGNILAPPLPSARYDFVYSLGVLHHTPDARAAFLRSASLVKPGGRLGVWLYPTELSPSRYARGARWIRDDLIRPITCRMPPRLLRRFSGALGRLTFVRDEAAARYRATGSRLAYTIAMCTEAVAVGRHRDPEIAAFLNFDWYAPQYRSYHSEDQVRGWYEEAGFPDVTLLPQRVSAVGTRRREASG